MLKAGDLVKWPLITALILLGWMAFLRVSELVGSGRTTAAVLHDGPSGLDVCDVKFVHATTTRGHMEVPVRTAKNHQTGEGEMSVVCDDALNDATCAVSRVKQWMAIADLSAKGACTKGALGCGVGCRPKCVCDCAACGKLLRQVVQGWGKETPVSRQGVTRITGDMYERLEEDGVVESGTAANVSGIPLRPGGVTEAAVFGIEREIMAGHGRWKGLSGPEHYDRNDERKYEKVSHLMHQSMRKKQKAGSGVGRVRQR